MKGERYGINAPKIGPCEGYCGQPGRGRIKPCYPFAGGRVWLCANCINRRQSITAGKAQQRAVADGGQEVPK